MLRSALGAHASLVNSVALMQAAGGEKLAKQREELERRAAVFEQRLFTEGTDRVRACAAALQLLRRSALARAAADCRARRSAAIC